MKVLHVIPAIAKRYGGPSVAVTAMCRALRQSGVDTLIASTDADGPGRLGIPTDSVQEFEGVPVRMFPRLCSESFKYAPALAAWLTSHVTEFDVVHLHAVMSHACVAAARACRRSGVPYVLRTLGTLDKWSYGQKPLRKRAFMTMIGQSMLEGAAAVQATAQEECNTLQHTWGVSRTALIPLGVDESIFHEDSRAAEPMQPPYVVALGRLHPVKGLDLLIDAFSAVASTPAFSDWRLVIAGDGEDDYVSALKERALQGTACGRIEFTGWVDGKVKIELLRRASIAALTSQHENFGIALVEAMALGVPGLATSGVQIAPAIAESGAGWTADFSQAAIEAALESAFASGAERRLRGDAARRLVTAWRWPVIAKQLIDLYQSVRETRTPSLCAASPA
jgi:glycosyltransferase involved in cell wall biosynthesis